MCHFSVSVKFVRKHIFHISLRCVCPIDFNCPSPQIEGSDSIRRMLLLVRFFVANRSKLLFFRVFFIFVFHPYFNLTTFTNIISRQHRKTWHIFQFTNCISVLFSEQFFSKKKKIWQQCAKFPMSFAKKGRFFRCKLPHRNSIYSNVYRTVLALEHIDHNNSTSCLKFNQADYGF